MERHASPAEPRAHHHHQHHPHPHPRHHHRRSPSRSRSRSRSQERRQVEGRDDTQKHEKQRHACSSSESETSSTEDEEERRRRHKHKKQHKQHKQHKQRKRKRAREEKQAERSHRGACCEYGTYGILLPEHMHQKQPEFEVWMREVKGQEPSLMNVTQLKEWFKSFIEDYNTVTMPHKKFYDLARWEAKEARKRAKEERRQARRRLADPSTVPTEFNDEEILRNQRRANREAQRQQEAAFTRLTRLQEIHGREQESMLRILGAAVKK